MCYVSFFAKISLDLYHVLMLLMSGPLQTNTVKQHQSLRKSATHNVSRWAGATSGSKVSSLKTLPLFPHQVRNVLTINWLK